MVFWGHIFANIWGVGVVEIVFTETGLDLPGAKDGEERGLQMYHAVSPDYISPVSGRPRFGSVRLRFGGGTVRAVPVFGSGGSSAKKGLFCVSVHF